MLFLKKYRSFFSILGVLIAIVVALSFIEPVRLVEAVGIQNIYLFTFLFAIIGGVSAISAASYYATLFAFALGGANPFLLALCSAPGVLIGDYAFWYLGLKGRGLAKEALGRRLARFSSWIQSKPAWFLPIVIFIYTAFTPLPGDFLMIALAVTGYTFRQILIPTLLGNYMLALLITLSATRGIPFVVDLVL